MILKLLSTMVRPRMKRKKIYKKVDFGDGEEDNREGHYKVWELNSHQQGETLCNQLTKLLKILKKINQLILWIFS